MKKVLPIVIWLMVAPIMIANSIRTIDSNIVRPKIEHKVEESVINPSANKLVDVYKYCPTAYFQHVPASFFESSCTEYDIDQFIVLSPEDRDLLARVVYFEGRGESFECQQGICSVILNRYMTGSYKSIKDVVYEPNQFSVAPHLYDENPTDIQYEVVDSICQIGPIFSEDIIYFRSGYYHNMKGVSDYISIDNTYFSSNDKISSQIEEFYDTSYTE